MYRILSIADSTHGIAHHRDLMIKAPVELAHLLKAVWKELLLRGMWGSSRCGWEGDGVTGVVSAVGDIEAADAAKIFHASTRRRTSACNLRRPRASAVMTAMVGFCERQRALLSSASLTAMFVSRIVATSSIEVSSARGGGSTLCIA